MGLMNIMTQAGDETLVWDPEKPDDVERAKADWERLHGEGYEFYEAIEAKGRRLTKFDPGVGRVIAAPGAKKAADKAAGTRPNAMAGGPNATLVA